MCHGLCVCVCVRARAVWRFGSVAPGGLDPMAVPVTRPARRARSESES